jgi:predicted transposase YdaD
MSEVTNAALQEKVLEFIQTVVIDKFPNLTLEELEVMLDLESLRKSKVYQEGISEGVLKQKLETIPILIELGLTTDQIAERLKLDVQTVRENVKK